MGMCFLCDPPAAVADLDMIDHLREVHGEIVDPPPEAA